MRLLSTASVPVGLIILLRALTVASPLSVNAGGGGSSLVQQSSGGCNFCSMLIQNATFGGSVSSGDVIVVMVASFVSSPFMAQTVTDTLGSSFTEAAYVCNTPAVLQCVGVYYASALTGGADTVSVNYASSGVPLVSDIFVYEVSGVTTSGATASTGFAQGTSVSTAPNSFASLGFVVSAMNSLGTTSYAPGAGFTASTPSSGSMQGYAEYALSGVTSPTSFPATIGNNNYWAAAGLSLELAMAPPGVVPACPSTFGGVAMPAGATFTDSFGNTWTAPNGNDGGGATWSSYFFAGAQGSVPAPMQAGWGGDYGTYGGQQGWIITFYC